MSNQEIYDVIICGAGHAGCEAALAAARLGAKTLVLSGNLDAIAQMACNPAIGGQAKGHMVREIDALGGEMGINADLTGIQFKLLNASKGPAVQAPRVQNDKKAYQFRMKHTLELQENLTLFQATVTGLIYEKGTVVGCRTNLDLDFRGKSVVVTTGTFLRGLMHVGQNRNEGGRMGDPSSKTLSGSFLGAGIELRRLITSTPPRILGRSIDRSRMEEQKGDEKPTRFAFYDTRGTEELFHVEQSDEIRAGWPLPESQVSCWITYTNEHSQDLVKKNLHLSPMYSGTLESAAGPRYCPSIEDKFVRFSEKPNHRLFLEPEGRNTNEYYINGLSTSLPFDVQVKLVRTVPGLENAVLLRPGYAVEYDFAPPTQLFPTLESKKIENLFFAGQINGSSGYEEAAAQGLIAGINAALKVRGEKPFILKRHEGYIGVLIDDLTTKGTSEPYRMFTSRAEYRLLFNHGSAELRLLPHLTEHPLVPPARLARIREKERRLNHWIERFDSERTESGTWAERIRRQEPEIQFPSEFLEEPDELRAEVLYRVGYAGYLKRELLQIEKMKSLEELRIPSDLDFLQIRALKRESAEKLAEIRPFTLGQASRISGVNPADIHILMVLIQARKGRGE